MRTKNGINLALKIIGLTGLTATVIVASNATQAFAKLIKNPELKQSDYQNILRELKRQGLVLIDQQDDAINFSLTPAGAHRLQNTLIEELSIPRPTIWDKRWRIITFDIPVKMSRQRQKFTSLLQANDFYMLQRSIWIHPFPCAPQVEQLASHFNVLRYCSFIEAARLDESSTKRLVRHFSSLIAS